MRFRTAALSILVLMAIAGGGVIAQAVATDGIEVLVERAQARADALKDALTSLAQGGTVDRGQAYAAEARSLGDGNRARLSQGLGYLSPGYRADPFEPAQGGDGVIYIAVSLSMPQASLRQLALDAERANALLVLRGLSDGSFVKTRAALKAVFGGDEPAGLVIDPRVFEQFHVERVPAFVAAPVPVEACEQGLDCARPDVAFDVVRGNVSLHEALRLLSAKGTAAPDVARRALDRLGG